MKTYVIVTGVLFAAVFVAHVLRIFAEGPQLLSDPFWVILTALVLAMFVWSVIVLRKLSRM